MNDWYRWLKKTNKHNTPYSFVVISALLSLFFAVFFYFVTDFSRKDTYVFGMVGMGLFILSGIYKLLNIENAKFPWFYEPNRS